MAKRKLLFALVSILVALLVFPTRVKTRAGSLDSQIAENQERLAAILTKARSYCQRLERAALDFVCQEEVSEHYEATRKSTQDLLVPGQKSGYVGTQPIQMESPVKASNRYLYDYQFVRKNQQAKEKRELLEVNAETIIVYKNYRFFTVETEVKY